MELLDKVNHMWYKYPIFSFVILSSIIFLFIINIFAYYNNVWIPGGEEIEIHESIWPLFWLYKSILLPTLQLLILYYYIKKVVKINLPSMSYK